MNGSVHLSAGLPVRPSVSNTIFHYVSIIVSSSEAKGQGHIGQNKFRPKFKNTASDWLLAKQTCIASNKYENMVKKGVR